MLRGLTVVIIIVGVVALLVLGPRYLQKIGEPSADSKAQAATCDLDSGPCEWKTAAGAWSLALAPADEEGLGRTLTVKVPAVEDEGGRLIAVLKGHSMYMGEYPVALTQDDRTGAFRANVNPPVCSQDPDMIWAVTLQRGQSPITMPRLPVFQAHPR